MKILVVYDSQYGNTESIARSIGWALNAEIKMPRFGVLTAAEMGSYDLIIVGSPTQQGKMLSSIQILLDAIPPDGLKNVKAAAFDTRHKWRWVGKWGYAAPAIAEMLEKKGGKLIAPPEGFTVKSTTGPLLDGEIDRAAKWARTLLEKAS